MVTIKYDVSGANHEANASDQGEFVTPPKGVYIGKVEELNKGFSKDSDGKPDKSRPRLEVIYSIVGEADGSKPEANYSRVWDYVSFSDAAEWKLDQFLQAMGVDTAKKEKGNAKLEVGTLVKMRIKHEPGRTVDDEPRAKVGGLFRYEGKDEGLDIDVDEDDDDDEALDDEDVEFGEDEDEEGDADEPDLTAEDVDNMSAADLKDLVKEHGIKPKKGMKLKDVRELVKEELGLDEEDDDDVPF